MRVPSDGAGQESARLTCVRALDVLDTPCEAVFDAIARAAAAACGTPMATIAIVDRERVWFKARVGVDACETPRAGTPCDVVVRRGDALVVPEVRDDPRFAPLAAQDGWPCGGFYAGVPVEVDGQRVGVIAVADAVRRDGSHEAAVAALEALAEVTAATLRARRTRLALLASEKRLRDALRLVDERVWEIGMDGVPTWGGDQGEPGAAGAPMAGDEVERIDGRRPAAPMRFKEVLERGEPFADVLVTVPAAGGPRPMLRRGVPRRDAEGRLTGFRGVSRPAAPEPAIVARARAAHAQGEFVRRLGTALRGPLRAMRTTLEGAQADRRDPTAPPPRLGDVLQRVAALEGLADDLADLGRVLAEPDRVEEPPQRVDLGSICGAVIELLKDTTPTGGARLLLVSEPGGCVAAGTDRAVYTIVARLVAFALALPGGSGAVKLRVGRGRSAGECAVRVTVAAVPPGTGPDVEAAVFDPLRQASRGQWPGASVGPYLARCLAARLGGEVAAGMTGGVTDGQDGLLLTLYLPEAPQVAPKAAVRAAAPAARSAARSAAHAPGT
jgi:hypothetical protein